MTYIYHYISCIHRAYVIILQPKIKTIVDSGQNPYIGAMRRQGETRLFFRKDIQLIDSFVLGFENKT